MVHKSIILKYSYQIHKSVHFFLMDFFITFISTKTNNFNMNSIFNLTDNNQIIERIQKLTPESKAQWGKCRLIKC